MRLFVLALPLLLAATEAVPYGHPDFHPSAERPLGWRGDGTGCWPGARTVGDWDAESGRNVVWRVDTPGAGLCQPLVVGEKVLVTADPNLLCCYSVHDGTLLWQTAIDHTLRMDAAEREAARAEQAFWDQRWAAYARWRCQLRELEKLAPAVGKALIGTGFQRQGKRLPLTDEAQHQQLLGELSGEAKALYEQLQAQAEEHGWVKQGGNNGPMLAYDEKRWPLAERYRQAQERWDVLYNAYNNWLGYVTHSFATPVTDGELVYVTTANNAVAAVDLHGAIRWLVWEHLEGQSGLMHTRYVASPVLCDGTLVVNQAGHLRAYDAATGKRRWSVVGPTAVAKGDKPKKYYSRGDPEASSPTAGFIPMGTDGRLAVVSDSAGGIWRLSDGKLLAKVPGNGFGGDILLGDGRLISKRAVVRLRAADPDTVQVETLWEAGHSDLNKFSCALVLGGRVLGQPAGGKEPGAKKGHTPVYDLATGEPSYPFATGLGSGYVSPIASGDTLYQFKGSGDKHDLALSLGDDASGVIACTVIDLGSGSASTVANAAIDRRLHGDSDWAISNKAHGWGYQQSASPALQANRLFYRSRGVLSCIGDAQQRFPRPRDCPEAARVDR